MEKTPEQIAYEKREMALILHLYGTLEALEGSPKLATIGFNVCKLQDELDFIIPNNVAIPFVSLD